MLRHGPSHTPIVERLWRATVRHKSILSAPEKLPSQVYFRKKAPSFVPPSRRCYRPSESKFTDFGASNLEILRQMGDNARTLMRPTSTLSRRGARCALRSLTNALDNTASRLNLALCLDSSGCRLPSPNLLRRFTLYPPCVPQGILPQTAPGENRVLFLRQLFEADISVSRG